MITDYEVELARVRSAISHHFESVQILSECSLGFALCNIDGLPERAVNAAIRSMIADGVLVRRGEFVIKTYE